MSVGKGEGETSWKDADLQVEGGGSRGALSTGDIYGDEACPADH